MAGKGARILLTVMVTVLVLVDLVGCCYMWVDEIKQRTKTTDIKVDIPSGFKRGEVIFLFLFLRRISKLDPFYPLLFKWADIV